MQVEALPAAKKPLDCLHRIFLCFSSSFSLGFLFSAFIEDIVHSIQFYYLFIYSRAA
jgi:hypothetical protein